MTTVKKYDKGDFDYYHYHDLLSLDPLASALFENLMLDLDVPEEELMKRLIKRGQESNLLT